MSYDPRGSGLLTGSGGLHKRYKRGKVRKSFPDIRLGEGARIVREIPDYDPNETYTEREIILLTEKLLRMQAKTLPMNEEPAILFWDSYMDRLRREVYAANGTPDPSVQSGVYWRTHPNGRTVNSDEQRKKGKSYYR